MTLFIKDFAEHLDNAKYDENDVTPIEKSSGVIIDIDLKYHHIWLFTVYVINVRLQTKNTPGSSNWDPPLHNGIYLGH